MFDITHETQTFKTCKHNRPRVLHALKCSGNLSCLHRTPGVRELPYERWIVKFTVRHVGFEVSGDWTWRGYFSFPFPPPSFSSPIPSSLGNNFFLSPTFLCCKIQDGGETNATERVSAKIRLHCRLSCGVIAK